MSLRSKALSFILLLSFLIISIVSEAGDNALLWKITGKGLKKPSYLFGTIHLQNEEVYNFNEHLLDYFKGSDELMLELDLGNETKAEMQKGLMLADGKTLSDLMSKEDYELIQGILKSKYGMDLQNFETMKPFILIALPVILQKGFKRPIALDELFIQIRKTRKDFICSFRINILSN